MQNTSFGEIFKTTDEKPIQPDYGVLTKEYIDGHIEEIEKVSTEENIALLQEKGIEENVTDKLSSIKNGLKVLMDFIEARNLKVEEGCSFADKIGNLKTDLGFVSIILKGENKEKVINMFKTKIIAHNKYIYDCLSNADYLKAEIETKKGGKSILNNEKIN